MCCVIVSLRGFWNVGSRLLSEPLNSIRLDVSLVDPMEKIEFNVKGDLLRMRSRPKYHQSPASFE